MVLRARALPTTGHGQIIRPHVILRTNCLAQNTVRKKNARSSDLEKQIPLERRASALSTRPLLSCPQTAWHKTGHKKKLRAARSSKKQIPLERRASAISTRFLVGPTSNKFPCMIPPACRKKNILLQPGLSQSVGDRIAGGGAAPSLRAPHPPWLQPFSLRRAKTIQYKQCDPYPRS